MKAARFVSSQRQFGVRMIVPKLKVVEMKQISDDFLQLWMKNEYDKDITAIPIAVMFDLM